MGAPLACDARPREQPDLDPQDKHTLTIAPPRLVEGRVEA
jgi:hypothetical protein